MVSHGKIIFILILLFNWPPGVKCVVERAHVGAPAGPPANRSQTVSHPDLGVSSTGNFRQVRSQTYNYSQYRPYGTTGTRDLFIINHYNNLVDSARDTSIPRTVPSITSGTGATPYRTRGTYARARNTPSTGGSQPSTTSFLPRQETQTRPGTIPRTYRQINIDVTDISGLRSTESLTGYSPSNPPDYTRSGFNLSDLAPSAPASDQNFLPTVPDPSELNLPPLQQQIPPVIALPPLVVTPPEPENTQTEPIQADSDLLEPQDSPETGSSEFPSDLRLKTADDQAVNDTSKFSVHHWVRNNKNLYKIEFLPDANCTEIRVSYTLIWKYKDDGQYPKHILFDPTSSIIIRFPSTYLRFDKNSDGSEWVEESDIKLYSPDNNDYTRSKKIDRSRYSTTRTEGQELFEPHSGVLCSEVRFLEKRADSSRPDGFRLVYHTIWKVWSDFEGDTAITNNEFPYAVKYKNHGRVVLYFSRGRLIRERDSSNKWHFVDRELKLYGQDPAVNTKIEELDHSEYQKKSIGPNFEYEFKPEVRCVKVMVEDKPVWDYDLSKDDGKFPKSVQYDTSMERLVLRFDQESMTFLRSTGDRWAKYEQPRRASMLPQPSDSASVSGSTYRSTLLSRLRSRSVVSLNGDIPSETAPRTYRRDSTASLSPEDPDAVFRLSLIGLDASDRRLPADPERSENGSAISRSSSQLDLFGNAPSFYDRITGTQPPYQRLSASRPSVASESLDLSDSASESSDQPASASFSARLARLSAARTGSSSASQPGMSRTFSASLPSVATTDSSAASSSAQPESPSSSNTESSSAAPQLNAIVVKDAFPARPGPAKRSIADIIAARRNAAKQAVTANRSAAAATTTTTANQPDSTAVPPATPNAPATPTGPSVSSQVVSNEQPKEQTAQVERNNQNQAEEGNQQAEVERVGPVSAPRTFIPPKIVLPPMSRLAQASGSTTARSSLAPKTAVSSDSTQTIQSITAQAGVSTPTASTSAQLSETASGSANQNGQTQAQQTQSSCLSQPPSKAPKPIALDIDSKSNSRDITYSDYSTFFTYTTIGYTAFSELKKGASTIWTTTDPAQYLTRVVVNDPKLVIYHMDGKSEELDLNTISTNPSGASEAASVTADSSHSAPGTANLGASATANAGVASAKQPPNASEVGSAASRALATHSASTSRVNSDQVRPSVGTSSMPSTSRSPFGTRTLWQDRVRATAAPARDAGGLNSKPNNAGSADATSGQEASGDVQPPQPAQAESQVPPVQPEPQAAPSQPVTYKYTTVKRDLSFKPTESAANAQQSPATQPSYIQKLQYQYDYISQQSSGQPQASQSSQPRSQLPETRSSQVLSQSSQPSQALSQPTRSQSQASQQPNASSSPLNPSQSSQSLLKLSQSSQSLLKLSQSSQSLLKLSQQPQTQSQPSPPVQQPETSAQKQGQQATPQLILINVELKDKNPHVKFEENEQKGRQKFTADEGYFIDKVKRNGKKVWVHKEGAYADRIIIKPNTEFTKNVAQILFPGDADVSVNDGPDLPADKRESASQDQSCGESQPDTGSLSSSSVQPRSILSSRSSSSASQQQKEQQPVGSKQPQSLPQPVSAQQQPTPQPLSAVHQPARQQSYVASPRTNNYSQNFSSPVVIPQSSPVVPVYHVTNTSSTSSYVASGSSASASASASYGASSSFTGSGTGSSIGSAAGSANSATTRVVGSDRSIGASSQRYAVPSTTEGPVTNVEVIRSGSSLRAPNSTAAQTSAAQSGMVQRRPVLASESLGSRDVSVTSQSRLADSSNQNSSSRLNGSLGRLGQHSGSDTQTDQVTRPVLSTSATSTQAPSRTSSLATMPSRFQSTSAQSQSSGSRSVSYGANSTSAPPAIPTSPSGQLSHYVERHEQRSAQRQEPRNATASRLGNQQSGHQRPPAHGIASQIGTPGQPSGYPPTSCHSSASQQGSSSRYTLITIDANKRTNTTEYQYQFDSNSNTHKFIPRDYCLIEKVINGNEIIWQASDKYPIQIDLTYDGDNQINVAAHFWDYGSDYRQSSQARRDHCIATIV